MTYDGLGKKFFCVLPILKKSFVRRACFCSSYIIVFLWIHSTTDADEMMNESGKGNKYSYWNLDFLLYLFEGYKKLLILRSELYVDNEIIF